MAQIDDQFNAWLNQLQTEWIVEGSVVADPAQVAQLQKYWATLTPALKQSFFKQAQSFVTGPEQFKQLLMQSHPAVQPTTPYSAPTPAPDPTSATGVQASATTAATTATAQLPDFTTGQTGAGIPVVGSAGATIPGTTAPADFNSLLQNYYSTAFSQAGSDPNALAQLAGVTPQNLQQQYQSYTQGFARAQSQFSPGISGGTVGGQQPMSLPEFAQNKAQAMIGPWAAVLDSINTIWQSQTGQPMPASVVAGVVSRLNSLPQAQQSNVLYNAYQYMTNKASAITNKGLFDQTGSYASAVLSALPSSILTYTAGSGTGTGALGTGGFIGTEMQQYPGELQGEEVQQEISAAFEKALNRTPTAADMQALGTDPTPAAIQQYIDNQPMPGTSMTYGAYTQISGQLTPLWQQYFGRDPTGKEIAWGAGKSTEDITDFIDNSKSSVPGVTIGVKNDYESFINSLDTSGSTTHAFSAGVDDSLIKSLHDHLQSQSTGTPSPGAT